MRTTVTISDELIAKAKEATGIQENRKLFEAALEAVIQRSAAHRLAALGGTEPDLQYIPRRRFE